jgi:hypothetical protein
VPKNHWLAPVVHFAAHALVGSLVFIVIALPALGLSLLVHWLESRGAAGYVIVTIDAIAFTWHLLYSTYKAFKESVQ